MPTHPYRNGLPIATLTVKGPKGEVTLQATVDSGAFKSLIPLKYSNDLDLPLIDIIVVGVYDKPVEVKVYNGEGLFEGRKVADTIICHDLPEKPEPLSLTSRGL